MPIALPMQQFHKPAYPRMGGMVPLHHRQDSLFLLLVLLAAILLYAQPKPRHLLSYSMYSLEYQSG